MAGDGIAVKIEADCDISIVMPEPQALVEEQPARGIRPEVESRPDYLNLIAKGAYVLQQRADPHKCPAAGRDAERRGGDETNSRLISRRAAGVAAEAIHLQCQFRIT